MVVFLLQHVYLHKASLLPDGYVDPWPGPVEVNKLGLEINWQVNFQLTPMPNSNGFPLKDCILLI